MSPACVRSTIDPLSPLPLVVARSLCNASVIFVSVASAFTRCTVALAAPSSGLITSLTFTASSSRRLTPSEPSTLTARSVTRVSIALVSSPNEFPSSRPTPLPASIARPSATTSSSSSVFIALSSASSTLPVVSMLTFALEAVMSPITTWSSTMSPAVIRMSPSTVFNVAVVAIVTLPVVASKSIVPAPAVATSTLACKSISNVASRLM